MNQATFVERTATDEQFSRIEQLNIHLVEMVRLQTLLPGRMPCYLKALVETADALLLNNFPQDKRIIAMRMGGYLFRSMHADRGVNRYLPEFNSHYLGDVEIGMKKFTDEFNDWFDAKNEKEFNTAMNVVVLFNKYIDLFRELLPLGARHAIPKQSDTV